MNDRRSWRCVTVEGKVGAGELSVALRFEVFISTTVGAFAGGGVATGGTTEDQLEDDCSWERRAATESVAPPGGGWLVDGPGVFAAAGAG